VLRVCGVTRRCLWPRGVETWCAFGVAGKHQVGLRPKETPMWYRAVGCIVTLTLRLLAAPLAAEAQQPTHLPTVGWLDEGNWADKARLFATFLEGLRELGSVEGQHFIIARRDAEGHLDRLPGLAADLVRPPADLTVPTGALPARLPA